MLRPHFLCRPAAKIHRNFQEGVRCLPINLNASTRLEPVCRYLFRRVAVVPALAGMAVCVAMPAVAQTATETSTKTDSGSLGPVVAIVTPEYSDVLKGDAQIVISVEPRRYPAQSVELLVDGRSVSGVLPIQTSFKWKTTLFVDGPHTLTVRVTDTQGFVGQSETNVFINNDAKRTDVTAPVLSWVGIQNGQKLSGEVTVRLQARDDFGVKYVFMRLNPAITPDAKNALASWMTNRPPYEFKLDTSKYPDALYVLDAYAWDAMENEESAPRLTVGFYNHNVNATPFQGGDGNVTTPPATPTPAPTPAPANTPAPKPTPAVPPQSNSGDGGTSTIGNAATPANPSGPRVVDVTPVIPPAPPRFSFIFPTRQGALDNTPATTTSLADTLETQPIPVPDELNSLPAIEHRIAPRVTPPTTTQSVAPPAPVTPPSTVTTPPVTVARVERPRNDALPAMSALTGVTPSMESPITAPPTTSLSNQSIASTPALVPPSLFATARLGQKPALPPALTASTGSTTPSLPVSASGNFTSLPIERTASAATPPDGQARFSRNPSEQTTTSTPASPSFSITDGNSGQDGVIAARTADGTRIARSLDGLTTAPGGSVNILIPSIAAPSTPALTELPTSPSMNLSGAQSTPQAATHESRVARQSTPPASGTGILPPAPVVHPPVVVANNNTEAPLLPPALSAITTPTKSRVVEGAIASPNFERTNPAAPRETRPLIAGIPSILVPIPATAAATTPAGMITGSRIASATTTTPSPSQLKVNGATAARPTPPRVTLSPNFRQQDRTSRPEMGIVVSPLTENTNSTFTAMRDERLSQIAKRLKLPLNVLAAANNLQPSTQVKKGAKLLLPQTLQVSYKGQAVKGDVSPLLIGGKGVAPFRFLFEQQGGKLTWDAKQHQVTAKNDKHEITITIGSDVAIVNQKEELMEMAAFLLSGRTMVPIRFFEKSLHATVEWEPSTGRLYVAAVS